MTVYQIAGTALQIDGDNGSGTLTVANSINPITGGMGVNTVRIFNDGSNNASVTFTPTDITYEFADVTYTTDSADGASASFTITVTSSGYEVTVVDGGVDFLADDVISVVGTQVGGTTTANDLTFTVATVNASTGAILTISAVTGTQLWPQSTTGAITMPPNGIEFIQVTNTPSIGCYFTGNTGDTGNVFVTPVAIVG